MSSQQLSKQIIAQYQPVQLIGSGAYGHVWRVIDRKTKTTYALKKSFDAFQNSTDAQRTYRQIMFLQQLKHPHIIKMHDIIRAENDRDIYILFQLMDIDLYSLIRQNLLTERHRRYIAYQIALSIQYMHSVNLVHRDIKPSNVLVNQDCLAKICDFGLVRGVNQQQQKSADMILTQYIATRWYRAPELLLGSKKYTKAVDIWSFGCLVGQMLRTKPLFAGNSTLNQLDKVLAWTGPPSLPDVLALKTNFGKQMLQLLNKIKPVSKKEFFPSKNYSDQGVDIINKCLAFNPDKRPTIQQALKHSYFKQFYKEQHLYKKKNKEGNDKLFVWDQTKLSVKQYRRLIYNEMKISKQAKDHVTTQKNKSEVCTPSPIVTMQTSDPDPRKTIKSQYGTYGGYSRGASNKSQTAQNHSSNHKHDPYTKPRTISAKKKYGSLLAKSPQQSRKKYIKTQEKYIPDQKTVPRKKSSSNGVQMFCQNAGSIGKTVTNTDQRIKNSLQKRPGGKKMSQGLARFFYRRGKLY